MTEVFYTMSLRKMFVPVLGLLAVPAALAQVTITSSAPPNGEVGSTYSFPFTANAQAPVVWSSMPSPPAPGLTLSQNGLLSGTPATPGGPFQFTVTATETGEFPFAPPSASQTYSITIFPQMTITTASLPNATVGKVYSDSIQVAGGDPPYVFTLVSTSPFVPLPSWLSISTEGGLLSGTPTTADTYNFFVKVTDSAGGQVTQQYSLTVTPPLTITTTSPLPQGTYGANYSQGISVSGGTPPYVFSIVQGAPPGLSISTAGLLSGTPSALGTFPFTVQVTDSLQDATSKQFQVTIVSAPQLLQVSPTLLSFSAVLNGSAPPPQTVSLQSAQPVDYGITINGGLAPTWLRVKPLGGATPGVLVISVDQTGLAASPAPFNATITVSVAQNNTQLPVNIQVSLTVTAEPSHVQVMPQFLRFAARSSTPVTLQQVIAVSNIGGGAINFTATVVGHSSWIANLAPASAQAGPNAPTLLVVVVNTAGQGVGSFHDVIQITTSAGTVTVPVSLFVSDQGSILGVNVNGVRFPGQQGSVSSFPKTVNVLDLGDPGTAVNFSVDIMSGFDWLSVTPSTGTATPGNPAALSLTAGGSAPTLAVGGHYALVQISDPQALNSPQFLVVVLDIELSTSPALPDPTPAGVFFTTEGGAPGPQIVNVPTSSIAPVPFQVATSTTDGAPWLSATATTATASTTAPGVISISVNTAILAAAGIYTGGVNVAMSGTVVTINITLVLVPGTVSQPQVTGLAPRPQAAASCTPSHLAATETGLVNGFSAPAGWPATLIIQLNDDCGNPVANGSAVASFSNGDPPLTLTGDQQTGLYSTTWQPGTAASSATVTILASAPGLTSVTVQITGGISANASAPPSLVPNAVSNLCGPVLGQALAPGTVAQVYGSNMASSAAGTGVVPLLTEFNGTFMLVGSTQVPLFFVSNNIAICNVGGNATQPCGVLDVEIPIELAPNRQYSVVVSANGALTLPQTIDVVPLQPGIKTYQDPALGSFIVQAQHTDPSIPACNFYYECLDSLHPAHPGETLVIYLTGMGATNPSFASGDPATTTATTAVQPTITLDGQNVNFSYAGLVPTAIGLYQIDLVVPNGPFSSNLVNLVIDQDGVISNTVQLPVANH